MENALDAMHDVLAQIDVLCVPSIEKSKEFHQNLKCLFDLSIKSSPDVELGPLMELYVTNMDSESIWEQVQSRNRPLNRYIERNAKKLFQSTTNLDVGSKSSARNQVSKNKKVVAIKEVELSIDDSDESVDGAEEVQSDDDSDDDDDDNSDYDDNDDDNDDDDDDDACSEGEDMDNWLDTLDDEEMIRAEVGTHIFLLCLHVFVYMHTMECFATHPHFILRPSRFNCSVFCL
jgi:hypothetical protein